MRFSSRRRLWLGLLVLPIVLGIWMWRAASWRPRVARVSKAPVLALSWSKDGKTIQTATGDGSIQTLSASSLKVLSSKGKTAKWGKAQFSDDGRLVLAGDKFPSGGGEEVLLLDATSGRTLWNRSFKKQNQAAQGNALGSTTIVDFALSSRGNRIAVSESFGNFESSKLFDTQNGHVSPSAGSSYKEQHGVFAHEAHATLAFSSTGTNLISWNYTSILGLWDTRTLKAIWFTPGVTKPYPRTPNDKWVNISPSPDGLILAVSVSSSSIYLFNSLDGKCSRYLYVWGTSIPIVSFSPNSQLLAAGHANGSVELFDVNTGRTLRRLVTKTPDAVALAFSPDSSRLAVGTSNGQVQLWRIK